MFILTISSLALVDVLVPITARKAGVDIVLSAESTAQMAFTTSGADPVGGDWKTATWETDATSGPVTYELMCLVGPGGTVTLAKGTYTMWAKNPESPEINVQQAGILIVT